MMKRNLEQLANQTYDLLVIGGGIHGACIAWDATLRGLSVALIERGDFGQETSANSLKTVHGGLRYLQDADLNLVRIMIQERTSYLRIAPHLVHPLPCLTPTYSRLTRSKLALGVALKLNDFAGYDRNRNPDPEKHIPSSCLVSRKECLKILPGLPDLGVTGGAIWHDGQVYDTERLTLSFVHSAEISGTSVANYVEAIGLLREGSRVIGIEARDALSGDEFDIQARVVVNSAGPWVDNILKKEMPESKEKLFNHSLAMNIVTRKVIDEYGAGVPSWPKSKVNGDEKVSHMLFVSPWRNRSLIGTFHSHYHGDPDQFQVNEEDLENILAEINSAYPEIDLILEDITFVHHGFLPEEKNSPENEVSLIRKGKVFDHRREDGIKGLITVMGVKYTTARQLAEKTVDLVFEHLGRSGSKSMTDITQLHDGQIESFTDYLNEFLQQDSSQLESNLIDHLVRSYGTAYPRLRELIDVDEVQDRLELVSPQVIRAQVYFAVREEMALKLSDVILRRTGLGSAGKPDKGILQLCAEIMAAELGWDKSKKNKEVDEVNSVYKRLGLGEVKSTY
jgi:glycerol-3-phosphate dehydrogenase